MKQILIVDDWPDVVQALEKYFQLIGGYEVMTAMSGEEALAYKTKPDLLLTDIDMPGMNGLTLAEKLRERYPGLPVIFLTGSCYDEIRTKAANMGCVIEKGRSTTEIKDAIEGILRGN